MLERGSQGDLFTSDEVGNYQASEAELVAAPLRNRIVELERMLVRKSSGTAELERALAQEVNRNTDLENRIKGYDHDRHIEKKRADEAESRVESLTGQLSVAQEKARRRNDQYDRTIKARDEETLGRIEARDNLLNQATTRINAVREILSRPAVVGAREQIVTRDGAILADAIGNALSALEA
jgi:chromosome segregation ATPase